MARPTPTVSFGSSFNATTFRTAIRNAMVMGLPNATLEKPTFQWTPERTYAKEDPGHNPYTWTATPATETTHEDVQVPCAVEFVPAPGSSADTPIGQFDASRVAITILDTDYAEIEGADTVLLGGNTYTIDFVAPPVGLFEVTVYTLYASAQDEA